MRRADPGIVQALADDLGLPHFLAAVMATRGITTAAQAEEFLTPNLERDWLNPLGIPGLEQVASALQQAILDERHIVVFGDFDLDGISATTVLTRGLRELGATVTPFIPHRFDHGYGISPKALEAVAAIEPRPDIIVTVDNGISCKDSVALAQEMGFDVLITDHHEPADAVPVGVPVADPKLDSSCPSTILAGVGVALKLVQALGSRFGRPYLWRDYTDFAALGTMADLMPMVRENRALVSDGLARINRAPRPCLAALLAVANAKDKPVTSTNLSFSVVPRLNAAGRMGDSRTALDLLLTDDYARACELAAELDDLNNQRRQIELDLSNAAQEQASRTYHGQRALVVWGEGWHEGVKGIVASRLVNQYGVPSILFTVEGDEARGSGRSVGRVSLFRAVESCQDLLVRFGGHDAAVGITIKTENLEEFNRRLCAYMDALPQSDFHPLMRIDAVANVSELTMEAVSQLERLEPFGQENPVPRLLARDVSLNDCRGVGGEKDHLSCTVSNGATSISGIMFHCGKERVRELQDSSTVANVVFEVQIDEYRGRRNVKAMIKEIVPAYICKCLVDSVAPEDQSFIADLYDADKPNPNPPATPMAFKGPAPVAVKEALTRNREMWQLQARQHPEVLRDAIVSAIIGTGSLHPSQAAALDELGRGRSILSVMATGRGKSLVFQVHAARMALERNQASLFIYPLRALIADQAYHLNDALKVFGVTSVVLNGETPMEARAKIFDDLAHGAVDIVLTTPEFLECHVQRFAQTRRIGFVVVDEAHHIAAAQTGNRASYGTLASSLHALGDPLVLACTATANDRVAEQIMQVLPIDRAITDQSSRDNLQVLDSRGAKNRDDYLAHLVARGEKTIIYVNSREQSVHLARILRNRVPQLALRIGFYNAGLMRQERQRVEELFRSGAFVTLVATSAFGEGVNIADVRNVVLYNLPFSDIELNQISGRAGRDGMPATIHLLYNRADAAANEGILRELTPDIEEMRGVYRALRNRQRQTPGEAFPVTYDEADGATRCGIAVFSDLGLIEATPCYIDGRRAYLVRVKAADGKVELSDSVRYREGMGERLLFQAFRDWVLSADAAVLQRRIANPIVPRRADRRFGS